MRQSFARPPFRPLSPFLAWPVFCAKPPFSLPAFVHGLEQSQWEPADALVAGRRAQQRLLLEWAVNNVAHYRKAPGYADALAAIRRRPDEIDSVWPQLPILTKAHLRALGRGLDAPSLPPGHGPLHAIQTSGSTGIPVTVGTTELTRLIWDAETIRDHLWHRRDFSKRLGVIRWVEKRKRVPGGAVFPSWGRAVAQLFSSGQAASIHVGSPLGDLVAWLKHLDPHYVLTYPSVAAALLDELGSDRPPSLEELRLFAEPVDPELEQRLQTQWQVRCANTYSANEVGYIAIQCPERNSLHVQSESLLVEILDEAGQACGVGDTGRVVLTPLHNLATPLLRYEIGDYATVGAPCLCGRTSAVIQRVLGRVRNMARSPDGRRFYPVGVSGIRNITPIRQAQYVQSAADHIDLRVVLDRPLTEVENKKAIDFVRSALGFPYEVAIVAVDAIERGPTGKFEEFLSLLPDK